jgi:hypothetical protein
MMPSDLYQRRHDEVLQNAREEETRSKSESVLAGVRTHAGKEAVL